MNDQSSSPNTPSSAERQPGASPESLPVSPAAPVEVVPQGEPAPAGPAADSPPPTLNAVSVAAATAQTPTVGAAAVLSQSPNFAGDVDVIEPEWVEKAESVLREHQGDPYGEEEAIQKLQEDYLQKRYGISVAEPNADETKPKGT